MPKPDRIQEIKGSAVSTLTWYAGLSFFGVIFSFVPLAIPLFVLFQLWILLRDVNDADNNHRLLQNLVASSINVALGWLLRDPWGLISLAPLVIVIATALDIL